MWLVAGAALLLGVVPCGVVCVRGDPYESVVGLQAAGTVITLALLVLAVTFGSVFVDVALVLGSLSFVGGMVFVRFLESWR